MAGLQRSAVSFRRSGSSGLVWDDKLVSGELNKLEAEAKSEAASSAADTSDAAAVASSSRPAALKIDRSRSNGGRGFKTGKVSPSIEPPSPKLSACACCNVFAAKGSKKTTRGRRPPKAAKRVM